MIQAFTKLAQESVVHWKAVWLNCAWQLFRSNFLIFGTHCSSGPFNLCSACFCGRELLLSSVNGRKWQNTGESGLGKMNPECISAAGVHSKLGSLLQRPTINSCLQQAQPGPQTPDTAFRAWVSILYILATSRCVAVLSVTLLDFLPFPCYIHWPKSPGISYKNEWDFHLCWLDADSTKMHEEILVFELFYGAMAKTWERYFNMKYHNFH